MLCVSGFFAPVRVWYGVSGVCGRFFVLFFLRVPSSEILFFCLEKEGRKSGHLMSDILVYRAGEALRCDEVLDCGRARETRER